MFNAVPLPGASIFGRMSRWFGGAVLVTSIGFIGHRLSLLDWSNLQAHASWPLALGLAGAGASFAVADHLLARAWATTIDPMATIRRQDLARIYARGVLMKYVPTMSGKSLSGAQTSYDEFEVNGELSWHFSVLSAVDGIQLSHFHEYQQGTPRLYHLISGRRSARPHHNPAFGAWLRRTRPFLRAAV